ncbi:MAG TPA: hypothetical protein PKA47_18800, partial [Accumulibacter sp.]|uniref:hypothetical protein n=1 Tax=Accumulibacter sp. TaxID=2053492 RepID=UPI002C8EE372
LSRYQRSTHSRKNTYTCKGASTWTIFFVGEQLFGIEVPVAPRARSGSPSIVATAPSFSGIVHAAAASMSTQPLAGV